jgi:hypothetical protein
LKRKKREKKKAMGKTAWLKNKTGCGINDGLVRQVCVYAEQFCFLKVEQGASRLTCCTFFLLD